MYRQVFDDLPCATLVLDSASAVVALQRGGARALRRRCWIARGCAAATSSAAAQGSFERPLAHHCLTAAVLEHDQPLRDLDFTLRRPAAWRSRPARWPAASARSSRCGRAERRRGGHGARAPTLRITTLGGLRLEREGSDLGGDWLHHRPGQLLRYLICARGHRVPVDELVEGLWPHSARAGVTSLRQAVHQLRERLEPDRPRHAPSRFIQARAGAYSLDMTAVVVDADEFETEANAALLTSERSSAVGRGAAAQPRRRALRGRVPGRRALRGLGAGGARAAARAWPPACCASSPTSTSQPAELPPASRGAAAPRRAGAARPGRAARPDRADAAPRAPRRGRPALRPRPPPVPAGVRPRARLLARPS